VYSVLDCEIGLMTSVFDRRMRTEDAVSLSEDVAHSLARGLGAMTSLACLERVLLSPTADTVRSREGVGDRDAGEVSMERDSRDGGMMLSAGNVVCVAGAELGNLAAARSSSSNELFVRRSRSRDARRSFSIPSSICSASIGVVLSLLGGEGDLDGGEWLRLNRCTKACFDMYLWLFLVFGLSLDLVRPRKNP
jgi:hypothetical protein